MNIKIITKKADELAVQYNKTKDPSLRTQWFELVSSLEPPPSHIQTSDTILKPPLDQLQKRSR
jgi:hypothetical protein